MIVSVSAIEAQAGQGQAALKGLGARVEANALDGRLLGCWVAEIGRLDRVLLLRGFDDATAAAACHARELRQDDAYGVASVVKSVELDLFALFPGVDFMRPGRIGPVYEVRSYALRHGGLEATFAAWEKVLNARVGISPLVAVMYALTGATPRFMHIWPYATVNDRTALRSAAVKAGVWPPPGGLPHIASMHSEIYLPAAFSPLQ